MVYVVLINTLGCLCETMVVGLNDFMISRVWVDVCFIKEMKTWHMERNANLYTWMVNCDGQYVVFAYTRSCLSWIHKICDMLA